MSSLPDKIIEIHRSLTIADIPHAFGGALALAWCTERARGTVDIDINVFVNIDQSQHVFESLPDNIPWDENDHKVILRDGQVRLWWGNTPLDIFLNTTELHEKMARRCRWETFVGESVPFISCKDLAILKVFFNRTKDWADLEEMQSAGTLDISSVTSTIIEYLGTDDERIAKLGTMNDQ